MEAVNVSDLRMPSGKTWKEENLEQTHKIPLDTLVEVIPWEHGTHNGIRAFVAEHTRDCDGTPLYSLSMEKGLRRDKYGDECKRIMSIAFATGFSEDSLKIVEG